MKRIVNFTDLNAWKESHKLAMLIYKHTEVYPRKEVYGLTSQIRRSAVSVSSNISEGFGRRTRKEKTQFYSMSLGSLSELQNQLILSNDIGYIVQKDFRLIFEQTIIVQKLINGLTKSVSKLRNT